MHVYLDQYPEGAKADRRILDDLRRNFLAEHGVQQQLVGLRDDDIFLLTEAEEVPNERIVTFLKLHGGYGEPVGLRYTSTVFGYYWRAPANTESYAAVTIGFLRDALGYKAAAMRRDDFVDVDLGLINGRPFKDIVISNGTDTASGLHPWFIGEMNNVAAYTEYGNDAAKPIVARNKTVDDKVKTGVVGWQCLSCCNKRCIVDWLKTSPVMYKDKDHPRPRWAILDQDDDVVGEQVERFIGEGRWFDDVTEFDPVEPGWLLHGPPKNVRNNPERYRHLLMNENATSQRTY